MKALLSAATIVVSAAICGASANDGARATNDIARLREQLLKERIVAMRVLFLPYAVVSKVPIDPVLLRRAALVDKVVPIDDELRQGLILALEQTTVEPLENQPDVRWGTIFLAKDGKEVHSVYLDGRYFDGTGRRAIVDGTLVKTNGAFGFYLEHLFPNFLSLDADEAIVKDELSEP